MTTAQLPLTGLQLKEQGIASLERHEWVRIARNEAEHLCQYWGSVTSDDLHDEMAEPPHPNCYGAIFHDKRFVWTGRYVKSTRREAHGREIRVWRLSNSERTG